MEKIFRIETETFIDEKGRYIERVTRFDIDDQEAEEEDRSTYIGNFMFNLGGQMERRTHPIEANNIQEAFGKYDETFKLAETALKEEIKQMMQNYQKEQNKIVAANEMDLALAEQNINDVAGKIIPG